MEAQNNTSPFRCVARHDDDATESTTLLIVRNDDDTIWTLYSVDAVDVVIDDEMNIHQVYGELMHNLPERVRTLIEWVCNWDGIPTHG